MSQSARRSAIRVKSRQRNSKEDPKSLAGLAQLVIRWMLRMMPLLAMLAFPVMPAFAGQGVDGDEKDAAPVETSGTAGTSGSSGTLSPTAKLANWGITFPFTYTGEVMGNLSGGYKQGVVYDGLVKTGVQLDLEKLAGWKGATFLVNGLYPFGPSITGLYTHDFNGVSNINAYNSVRLDEAWLQQNFDSDKLSIRIGQLAADTDFGISNGCSLFINSAFGTLPLESKNIDAPVYPLASPGVRIRVEPTNSFSAQFAVYTGDAGDQATTNRYGTRFFKGGNGALFMSEIAWTLNPPPVADDSAKPDATKQVATDRALSGTYKLGGFYDTATFENPCGDGNQQGEYAVYMIADQEIWNKPGNPDQGLRLFGRIGAAPADRSIVSIYCDGGVNYQGLLPSRDKDICGIGVSYTKISDDLNEQNDTPVTSHHETILEASYQAAICGWLSVQPDFQYIFSPGAIDSQHNAVVVDLRFTVSF